MSKQLSTLLRHGHLPREDDGAIEFWRLKEYLRNDLVQSQHWSGEKWRSTMAKGGGKQEKISILYWSIRTGKSWFPSSSRSSRTQSHWSFITGPYVYSERPLRVHLSHRMCDQFTLHHEFRIDTRRTKFEQKTDGILHVCGSMNKEHKDPDVIDLDAPRLAWNKQKVWKKHRNTVLGRHQTCSKERI